MGPNWGHMGWWNMSMNLVFLFLLVAGIVTLIIVLVLVFTPRNQGQTPHQTGTNRAREVLDERYARGEIDTREYEERRQRLHGPPGA